MDRLKAGLVAKGYTQIYGLDYSDTFSRVAKMTSFRLFLSTAYKKHWPLYQLHINNVFLHGDLEDKIYMERPPYFIGQGEYGLICKLHKSLYGLKQASQGWFGKFNMVIQQFGMIHSETDHFVFFKCSSLNNDIYLVLYVDDIVITGNDKEDIKDLKKHFFQPLSNKLFRSIALFS